MLADIHTELLKVQSLGLLERLLYDKTTKSNIIWGTDAYKQLGEPYQRDREIALKLITGENAGIIKNRAQKALEHQSERTKQHAEVFTPLWICRMMNDHADADWFESEKPLAFKNGRTWQKYVDARRLEITCGEAPYLVSRYDASTGEAIPIQKRIGILDRKLRAVNENTASEDEWLKWARRAFEATYGYEFQGDNLLIARLNLLMTFEEYLYARWNRIPTAKEYGAIANIITWNIWQMDGLTGRIPYCKAEEEAIQLDFFDMLGFTVEEEEAPNAQPACRVYDWRDDRSKEFNRINKGANSMKFDFIIGNPPYQDETVGDNKAFAAPIYDKFMDACFKIADKVELIHPARFLFNAGGTLKAWNEKMLHDPHFKIIWYESRSDVIFPNTDIKGGIAVSLHDTTHDFGEIGTFTAYSELNAIKSKVWNIAQVSIDSFVSNRGQYRFSKLAYSEHPEEMEKVTDPRLAAPVFERMPALFTESKPNDGHEYVQIFGNKKGSRAYMWFRRDYLNDVDSLTKYKVFVPAANGSGAIGEVLSTPLIGEPLIGSTETYISIGAVDTQNEANAILKYIKSKFARTMLGILKITQHNSRPVWKYVPLQDFTANSDIDWSQSVSDIDRQLYSKYGLDEKEIAFIESHVKEMA